MVKFQNPSLSNEQLGQHLSDYLYNTAAKQIFNKTQSGSGISFDPTYKDKQDQKAIDESNKYKPSYEGNVDKTPSTRANALVTMGMDPTIMDDNADIKYNKYNQPDIKDVQSELTTLNNQYKGNESSPDYMHGLNKIISQLQASKGNQEIATKYYSDLVRIAGNNNIDPKQFMDNKGNVDYKVLKERLITAGQNINTQAGTIQGMDASLIDGLGAYYFGEHTAQGFTKAGAFNKLTIYENNNPNSKDKIESEGLASKLAENARFTGLDFNDKNLGSMAFTATEGKESTVPKLYNAVTSDKVLKTLMEPVHNFTQQVKNAMVGKQSPEEVEDNKKALIGYTDKYGNKVVGALDEVASNVQRGNNPNKKYILEKLNEVKYGVTYGSDKTLAYGSNNDKDKIFIGQPIINEQGIPEEKTFRIDVRTGMVDVVELGNIQNEESTNIQNKIAPVYNQKAPGYKPQDVTYK
jgi:hypothetical protein